MPSFVPEFRVNAASPKRAGIRLFFLGEKDIAGCLRNTCIKNVLIMLSKFIYRDMSLQAGSFFFFSRQTDGSIIYQLSRGLKIDGLILEISSA